jgi:DNA mismatch repair protein MutL
LDPETVAHISAGEVVERPASVVKELIENAIDADASEVRVFLEGGGLDAIEVVDNGVGIPSEELPMALERHATNKIGSAEDLGSVRTLGFRGEALAAIAAVSRLKILSRPQAQEAAHGLSVEGGKILGRLVEGRPPGTSVRAEGLFFNTPARRKFLRSPVSELQAVLRIVERLYLASPSVGLTLMSEGEELARFAPTVDLAEAANRVVGSEIPEAGFFVSAQLAEGIAAEGFLGHPAVSRGNSLGVYFAVNARAIDSKLLAQSVRSAYQDYLPRTRFPVGVLHFRVDPSRVDVNVHPTKREVRIVGEREVADQLRLEIRQRLQSAPEVASVPVQHGPETQEILRSSEVYSGSGALGGIPRAPERSMEGLVEPRRRTRQRLLIGSGARVLSSGPLGPEFSLLGNAFRMYWIGENREGLVLIDQHAASERLLYDQLLRTGRLARQELLSPVRADLTPRQSATLRTHREAIVAAGLEIEGFGKESYRVRAVPVYRGYSPPPGALVELLDELAEGGRPTIPAGSVERRAASIACHSAVRGGDTIPVEAMAKILEDLRRLSESAYACPHGRPIRVLVPRSRLDRWFLREGG